MPFSFIYNVVSGWVEQLMDPEFDKKEGDLVNTG
jgi:hypothetical protein